MIYVLSGGVTNVAGVIRISYPANSTLVVKGTSSGKQFTKDTNTTSSAKAYIFLAPIGDASYTLTATNSAGKTVSKQVYVAKDQVQSVVLAYDYIIFSNETGLNPVYSDGGGGTPVEIGTDSSGKKTLTFTADGYSRMSYLKPAIDLTDYTTLKISGYGDGGDAYLAFWSKVPLEYDPSEVAKVVLSKGSSPTSYAIDVSKLSGSYYLGAQYAAADIVTYDLRLE